MGMLWEDFLGKSWSAQYHYCLALETRISTLQKMLGMRLMKMETASSISANLHNGPVRDLVFHLALPTFSTMPSLVVFSGVLAKGIDLVVVLSPIQVEAKKSPMLNPPTRKR